MLNTKIKQSGFTIVELLIVIVVIAILAAISIVAYNGIQNRGKASSSQAAASQVVKKAQAYYTVDTAANYPAAPSNFASYDESKLEGLTVVAQTGTNEQTAATYNDGKTAVYRRLGATTGGCVYWWDYTKTTVQQTPVYFGSVTTGC